MSLIVVLYVAILILAAAALLGAYRVLGTPSRLTPVDYTIVLQDVVSTVARSAARLRAAVEPGSEPGRLDSVATETRKIFQTGYYQTLRLRPATGNDPAVAVREILGQGCEAYEWASRMLGSSSAKNPVIMNEARRLLDAADAQLSWAAQELARLTPVPSGSTAP